MNHRVIYVYMTDVVLSKIKETCCLRTICSGVLWLETGIHFDYNSRGDYGRYGFGCETDSIHLGNSIIIYYGFIQPLQ